MSCSARRKLLLKHIVIMTNKFWFYVFLITHCLLVWKENDKYHFLQISIFILLPQLLFRVKLKIWVSYRKHANCFSSILLLMQIILVLAFLIIEFIKDIGKILQDLYFLLLVFIILIPQLLFRVKLTIWVSEQARTLLLKHIGIMANKFWFYVFLITHCLLVWKDCLSFFDWSFTSYCFLN